MAKGIIFTPQASNPLGPSQRGIWINNTGDMVYSDTVTDRNVSQTLTNIEAGVGITTISKTYLNSSGSTIPINTPVYSPSAGEIAPAYGTTADSARIIGVTTEEILDTAIGNVALAGIVSNVSGFTHGKYLYLGDDPGELIDEEPTILTYPSGFFVVIVGVVEGTNLILRTQLVGKL